jgi:transcriptional regulator with XRE-family HTH domain
MELRVREWRERRGVSLRELGEQSGVSYVTISRIENGQMSPTVRVLEKLARALGTRVRDLLPVERRPRR